MTPANRRSTSKTGSLWLRPDVEEAINEGGPVVLLETSIVAHGLPTPHNLNAALSCEEVINEAGAIPATVAVLDGALRIGVTEDEIRRLAQEPAVKVSARDLGWAIATKQLGATTVAGTLRAAQLTGLRFMATGGIGGVHLGRADDVSADLFELTKTQAAVFCSGPKSVLDVGLTLERLETLAVPVLGWCTDTLPAFYVKETQHRIPRVDSAQALRASWDTGSRGIVVAVPPPRELPDAAELTAQALRDTEDAAGPDLTPRLLQRIAELSHGRSVELNIELVVKNAREAGKAAVEYAANGPTN